MADKSTFTDFYTGLHHGYARVVSMTGRGPVLVVLPENGTAFEAWRSNREDAAPCGPLWTPEWMTHSKAYQEFDWRGAAGAQWNMPTSVLLPPLANVTFGFRLLLAPNVSSIDTAIESVGKAAVHAVPGYVISTEMTSAKLLITLPSHGQSRISAMVVKPAGAIELGETSIARRGTRGGRMVVVPVYGKHYGRAKVSIHYRHGNASSVQTVHYFILPPFRAHVAKFGNFQASTAWFDMSEGMDPFGRTSSVMPWDREEGKHVLDDPRPYVVGLSDEAGAGANVGLAMKVCYAPDQVQVSCVDQYIQETLCGNKTGEIPFPVSLQEPVSGGIRASLFWVPTPGSQEPGMPGYDYNPIDFAGRIWNYTRAVQSLGRAYNYPHQTAVYWSMYHAAENNDLLQTAQPALWYLKKAVFTIQGMMSRAPYYAQFGLMVGSVFREVLLELEREGLTDEAATVRGMMQKRAEHGMDLGPYTGACPDPPGVCACNQTTNGTYLLSCKGWVDNRFPFGSEFAWDSTGQEEIYVWGRYFGLANVSETALDAVLAFMPGAIPN
ncbi:hypothetical protein WJX72_000834 [[Myrmecia] bisecta]|uniref:Uncharacterized protein n=1 Tax=[Myrmecia] bisecta TaxID=41462 RepID=A0AAW1PT00_9CHLO